MIDEWQRVPQTWDAVRRKVDEAVAGLRRLRKKLCENAVARTRPPEFMAVLVGISEYARELEEGIYSIPLRALGA